MRKNPKKIRFFACEVKCNMNVQKNTYYIFVIFFICLFGTNEILAQDAKNPFELTTRLDATATPEAATPIPPATNPLEITTPRNTATETDTATEETETEEIIIEPETNDEAEPENIVIDTENPFEMITSTRKQETTAITEATPKPTKTTSTSTAPSGVKTVPLDTKNTGSLFGIVLGLCLLLAFLFAGFRSSFNKAIQNITNANILKQSYREMSTIGQMPLNVWYIFSWISMGVFVFLLMRYYGFGLTESYLGNLAYCIGIVSALMLLKHGVLFLIGAIFPTEKEVQLYNFLIIIFGVALGVFLVPANISIAYLPSNMVIYAIYVALALVALFYLLRSFRGLMISNRLLSFHRFHFLLYICAVEIAPVIILLKLGLLSAGK